MDAPSPASRHEHYPTTRAADVAFAAQLTARFRKHMQEDGALPALVAAAADAVAEAALLAPGEAAPAAPPGTRAKVVHFMRHGQGVHNALTESWRDLARLGGTAHLPVQALFGLDAERAGPAGPAYPPLVAAVMDAPLTARGIEEAEAARCEAEASGLAPQLLAVSPMRRAAVTGMTVFPRAPRIVAHESLHECSGLYPWDRRRDLGELRGDPELARVDLSLLRSEACPWWHDDRRETAAEMTARLADFMRWLRDQPEEEVAVAAHSHIIFALFQCGLLLVPEGAATCHGLAADSWFITGELRTLSVRWRSC